MLALTGHAEVTPDLVETIVEEAGNFAAGARALTPLAQIKSFAVSGCAPDVMGFGPVEATRKALFRAGIQASDLDVIEMKEDFAAQVLSCYADLEFDPARINRDGGRYGPRHTVHRRRTGHFDDRGGGAMA